MDSDGRRFPTETAGNFSAWSEFRSAGAGRGRDQTAGSLRGRRASRTHDDTGDTLFSELEHEGCNEVDWRQASCSGLCGRVRAQRGEVPGAACTGSEVVALGGVVTKTAPEFGDLSRIYARTLKSRF